MSGHSKVTRKQFTINKKKPEFFRKCFMVSSTKIVLLCKKYGLSSLKLTTFKKNKAKINNPSIKNTKKKK